jgi:hypothetical protein
VLRALLLATSPAWLSGVAACHHGAAPAEPPSCIAAADHVRGLLGQAPRASRIRETFVARCEADGWDDDARSCVVATTSLRKPRHCKAKLTPEQRTALDRELAEVAVAPGSASRLPPVCRDYGDMVGRLEVCPGMRPDTRGALEIAYRDLTQAWLRGTYDIHTVELQCRAMIDGLRQAVAVKCGW